MDGRLQRLGKGNCHFVVGLFPFLGQAFASRRGTFQRPGRFIQRSCQGVGGDSAVPDSPRKVHADLAAKDFHGLCGSFGAVLHGGNLGNGVLQGFLCIQTVGGKVLDGGSHGRDGRGALDAVQLHLCQQADGVFQRQAHLLQGRCASDKGIAQGRDGQAGDLPSIGQIVKDAGELACILAPLVHDLGDKLDRADDLLPGNIGKVEKLAGDFRKRVPGIAQTGVDLADRPGHAGKRVVVLGECFKGACTQTVEGVPGGTSCVYDDLLRVTVCVGHIVDRRGDLLDRGRDARRCQRLRNGGNGFSSGL